MGETTTCADCLKKMVCRFFDPTDIEKGHLCHEYHHEDVI